MLQQILKASTRLNHEELEQLMFVNEIMNGTLTLVQYRQILITNYCIHEAFENFLFDHLSATVAELLDIDHRRKLNALHTDLLELNITLLPLSGIPGHISFSKTDASILGALYVMEGATLGGSVINKKLKTNAQLNNLGLNFNYYGVYGDQLIPRWKTFCEVLNRQPESNYAEALESSGKMFQCISGLQLNNKSTL